MSNEFDAAAAAVAGKPADPLERAAADVVQGQRAQLRSTLYHSLLANPDMAARAVQLGRKTGIPADVVERNLPEVQRNVQLDEFDQVLQRSPAVAQWLTDQANAKVAHDDVDNLSAFDSALKTLGRLGSAGFSGLQRTSAGAVAVLQAPFDFTAPVLDPLVGRVLPGNPLRATAQGLAGWRRNIMGQAETNMPKADGVVEAGIYSGVASLATNLTTLPLAFFPGGQGAALTGMVAPVGGQAYGEARDKGLSPLQSATFGASQAAIEYATEKIPLSRLLGDVKAGTGFAKTLARQVAAEVPGEQVATVLQDLNEWATLNPDKPFSSYLEERPSAAAQTLIATMVGVGGQVTVVKGIEAAVQRVERQANAAQRAEQDAQALAQLDQLAAASKVRQRDADTFEAFVAQATEDGPVQDVFIDAKTLMQSGNAEALAQVSPSVAEQLRPALEAGGDIQIPIAEFAARIAGTEYSQSLLDHLKTEPGGMSRAEAREFMQTQADALQAEVQQALAEKEEDALFKAAADQVKTAIKTQLDQVARFTPEVNDAYASMVGNFYAVQAAKLGITPDELFQRYPLRVQAEALAGGQVLEQAALDRIAVENDRLMLDGKDIGMAEILPATRAERGGNGIEISRLYIDPEYQRRGAGGALIDRLFDQYPDAEFIDVYPSGPSEAFWLRQGAESVDAEGYFRITRQARAARQEPTRTLNQDAPDTDDPSTLKQNKGGARGAFNPATNTITLLKNADLSTFLHEAGHFFLETQFDMVSRLQGMRRDGLSLSEGEEQMLRDTSALLKWFGVADLTEWYALDFEQMRPLHEKFARGFEAYLFEGKAPSIELQGLFQRFRAWLLNVYRELKNLNVELSDDVRSVFDRMLATTEQIQLAEAGRSMLPLFTSPEQAGMTVEEFAAYQALGTEATAEAIQDVQARTLRDLAWTRNARGREIKRLQRQAAELRREVMMEVRREVMRQPVYRAWQFLTGKLSTEDKAALQPPARPKSGSRGVDESVDSLFTAIAKLGGLSRAEVERQWGWDRNERSPQPAFGAYLLRREGGKSIDAMGELLAARGYLPVDEAGKFDPRDFEELFDAEYRGEPQYSTYRDPGQFAEGRPGDQIANVEGLGAGRLDLLATKELDLPEPVLQALQDRKMTARDGLHPDIVADLFGFTSGDELVRALADATPPRQEIEGLTDARMLERYGELASPEAIERAADKAIHNEARARFVATEVNALERATGQRKTLASAARVFAGAMIARLKVRAIRPGQYASAEARAAKAAQKASQAGDLAKAAAEKRNQLVQAYAAKAAHEAQEEVDKGLRYLRKFDSDNVRKSLDADYADQIDALLERFDLRSGQSLKAIDKRTALVAWVEAQREAGMEPEVPPELLDEAYRTSYKDMTVEAFRGLVDTVRQIEHLGRLKNRLLTAADQRAFDVVKDEIVASIEANAQGRTADTRTPTTNLGRLAQALRNFGASHIKAATWARVMDGGQDGGPVWEYLVRGANDRGNMETTMRAEATAELSRIMAPVLKLGRMGGSGKYFPGIGRSLNREARLAIALNMGNEGNRQRLLGGEGWTDAQIAPVLQSLTAAEWQAVQAVWDHFDSYREQIGAKERRVYGKEPAWVEPTPLAVRTADGQDLALRGGYYPIKYDPAASQRAEEFADAEDAKRQLQGAFTSATTRRSFTKARAEEVKGRPLLYTLAGMYAGVNDVIHDLAWHEWLIDANRLLRNKAIDQAIRGRYGPAVKAQFKTWVADIAEGDKGAQNAAEMALGRLRQGVSAAGLGFNVMSAAIQITGFNQSIVRVGARWVGKGIAQYIGNPAGKTREVVGLSDFMADRSRTQFRELNELRNRVQDESVVMRSIKLGTYFMMMRMQRMVDVPTWLGAYEKAIADGNAEYRAVALADQAVIDSQGSGMTKDLSAVERGGPALKLFTVFYSYMNTALNMGVGQTMTAKSKAKLAADYLMLFTVPAVLGAVLKDALTPGGGDDEDWEALARKLAAEQLSYLMGLMVVVREFAEAAKIVTGAEGARDYQGPAGLRVVSDALRFGTQANQGEFDTAFRKSAINLLGGLTGLPAAQINRTITGTSALIEGDTENPAAVLFGYQE